MKYQNVASSLGWSEVPDITEGLYLQPEEARKIDRDLGKSNADSSSGEIANRDQRIKELENQVASLTAAGQSNGDGEKKKDAGMINNPEHPVNRLLDGKSSNDNTNQIADTISAANRLAAQRKEKQLL